jgi:integrase
MKRTTYKEPKFYLDGKPDSSTAAIFLKYTFAPGQRITYFTGERVEKKNWDADKQRARRNSIRVTDINDKLDDIEKAAKKAVRESRLFERPLTKETLKKALDTAAGKAIIETGFFDHFEAFVRSESRLKSWTTGTLKKVQTVKGQLEAFEQWKQKSNRNYHINMSQVDERFINELIEFWLTEYNLRNSTIQVNIKWLRWFLQWCVKKGLTNEAYKSITVNLKQTSNKVIYLDMDEIRYIVTAPIPEGKEYLLRTRDIFVFQCLTGLRFSDLFKLKVTDIHGDTIHVNTIKTGEVIEIELNDTTRSILEKYKAHQEVTGKALPIPQNPVYNRFLKELARLAGLVEIVTLVHYRGNERIEETFEKWQLITTHTARRSFITNGLALGIGSEVIRSWTGHQSEKSFKVYYEIVKARKRTDMNKMSL